jgi:excisionase family DNA binding protein
MYLTVQQVAERLHLNKVTVRRQIKAGKIRALRTGHHYRIPESALVSQAKSQAPDEPPELEELRRVVMDALEALAAETLRGRNASPTAAQATILRLGDECARGLMGRLIDRAMENGRGGSKW